MSQDEQATPTPRTDAAQKEYEDALALHGYDIKTVWLRFRETERELSAARAEAERLREDFAMMIRRLAARLQMRTRGTLHEQADESLVASALDLMRRNGVDLSPLREHRLEQSAIAATRKEEWNG